MINKSKIICIVDLALWLMLVVHIILLEFMQIEAGFFKVSAIITLVLVGLLHIWFVYTFFKNHKKVIMLQDQYVETLKPKAPLRFCPTDEELMKKHQEKIYVSQAPQEKLEKKEENTNEDSLELEMN